MGQSLYSLAHEYFTKRHDRNIVSYCSPQVYNILKDNINSPFLEFYKTNGTVAYDKNKQYTSILRSCDDFGWSLFNPTDEVKRYDSIADIETGLYFVETSNSFPLKGNGWYFDSVVKKALTYKLITKEDIKYYIKPSRILKQDHFYNFVSEIYDIFGCDAKYGINGFIGLLGSKTICKERHYFDSNYDAVANEIVNNENGSIQVRGIYKNNKSQFEDINLLNADDNELDKIINSRSEDEEPMIYDIIDKTEITKYENTLPIHRKIYDIANMEMYELYLEVMALNPKAELVGIKTDCLVFNKVKKDIELNDDIGGVKKCMVPEGNKYTLNQLPVVRTGTYDLEYKQWNNIEEDNINNLFHDGLLIYGLAGTGKTTKLKQIKNELHPDEHVTICPTHKACNLVDGCTIHRMFGINPIDLSYEYTKAQDLKNAGIKYIFIDEVSMVSERIWCILCHLKNEFNFIFIGFGDFKQLKPVNEEHIDFKNSWLVKHLFNNNSCELTKVHRFDENKLLQDAHDCAYGKSIDFNGYGNQEQDSSLCWTNDCVDALNTKYNEMYAKPYDNVKEVKGHGNTKFILHKNLQLMAYTSSLNKKYYNSEDFIVVDFDDDYFYLKTPKKDTIKIDIKFTNHFKPLYAMTVHKAQGMTINKPYAIYEYDRMKHDMLYVALTRTSK